MKLLFFAVNQSPFIVELIDSLYSNLPQGSCVKIILQHELDKSRSHWGLRKCHNPIEMLEFPDKIIPYLNKEMPNCIIFTGYRGKCISKIKRWAKKMMLSFF